VGDAAAITENPELRPEHGALPDRHRWYRKRRRVNPHVRPVERRGTSDIVRSKRGLNMKHFTAVIERDADTGLYVGWVPGFAGAHSQGATLDELQTNLQEVVEMLLEEGDPHFESVFIGTQTVEVA
jgi:predicted RNase H-like HicB family nuclease